jgi:sodium-dependent dicarboxylate transporter 2/3/5
MASELAVKIGDSAGLRRSQRIGLVLGPAVFLLLMLAPLPSGLSAQGQAVLACTLWIAVWWISEAIPIPVTALLPIPLFPLTGALGLAETTASYGHRYVFLYIGGFVLAIAIAKWNLHRRIALTILSAVGTDLAMLVLGFMLATALMSMWISNTATTVMMLPIGMALVGQYVDGCDNADDHRFFGKALMLAIAWSASIGGTATLIGTPPNLVLAGVVSELYGVQITFTQWFMFGFPLASALLLICWLYLTRVAFPCRGSSFPGSHEQIAGLLRDLGPMKFEEKALLIVFVTTALLWISRAWLQNFLPALDDTIIAVASGISLFLIPAGRPGERLVTWDEAVKLPWGILLLFGGGIAIAGSFEDSGLALWIANSLTLLDGITVMLLVLIVVASVNFLTEITSNLATSAMLLPVLAPMAVSMEIHPYLLLVAATVAASCAFMLPVATPPNSIVFGSGYLRIGDMVSKGFWMNLLSIAVLALAVRFLLPVLWDFPLNVPSSAPLQGGDTAI